MLSHILLQNSYHQCSLYKISTKIIDAGKPDSKQEVGERWPGSGYNFEFIMKFVIEISEISNHLRIRSTINLETVIIWESLSGCFYHRVF